MNNSVSFYIAVKKRNYIYYIDSQITILLYTPDWYIFLHRSLVKTILSVSCDSAVNKTIKHTNEEQNDSS